MLLSQLCNTSRRSSNGVIPRRTNNSWIFYRNITARRTLSMKYVLTLKVHSYIKLTVLQEAVSKQIARLFKDDPDLREEFRIFMPDGATFHDDGGYVLEDARPHREKRKLDQAASSSQQKRRRKGDKDESSSKHKVRLYQSLLYTKVSYYLHSVQRTSRPPRRDILPATRDRVSITNLLLPLLGARDSLMAHSSSIMCSELLRIVRFTTNS